jgi:GrpB-like predicted nucleotidyltransferase (UPF0157 family)
MIKPEIIPYQPAWPAEFEAIAAGLRAALGPLALRIDHIGSTAVPGLAAKDVIDVQITVAALDEASVQALTAALLPLGYSRAEGIARDHRPPGATGPESDWAKLYFHAPAGHDPAYAGSRTHIHVRALRRPNQRYPLLFRDYLRARPATAAAYAELKRRLAASLADPASYPDVKDPAVDLIYLAAEEWAAGVGWKAGEADVR